MQYFSGFCLKAESELFDFYLDKSEYSIAGFSYGAIKAFEYAIELKTRVDKLILISPAFFQDSQDKYKQLQLKLFERDKSRYIKNFLKDISLSFDMTRYLNSCTKEELLELLYYKWSKERLKILSNKGVEIEVVLGEKDRVINALSVKEFFEDFATIYYIKGANHILQVE